MATNLHKYDIRSLLISALAWELIFWLIFFSLFYYMKGEVDAFQFETPELLYLLFVIPLLVSGYFLVLQWKNRTLDVLAEGKLLRYLTFPVSTLKSFFKFFLFRNGIAFVIIALANPQFGRGKNIAVSEGIEIMIALDISNSMRALDLDRERDRLQIAKMGIERMLDDLHGDKVGLLVFAGDAFVQVPLTTDYAAYKMFLQSVRPEMMNNQGTSIGLAIDKSIQSFDMSNGVNKAIIIMSDGEDHEGNAELVAEGARENDIIICTVGMGTTKETPIPDYVDGKVIGLKKDDEGNTVYTRLNEEMLQNIASNGGGVYTRAEGTVVDLKGLVQRIREIEAAEIDSVAYVDYEDQYQWFLGLGLLFLFIEFFLTEKRTGFVHKLQEYNA